MRGQVHDMRGEALSSVAWAAARSRQHASWAPPLLQAIEDEALHRLRDSQLAPAAHCSMSDDGVLDNTAAGAGDSDGPAHSQQLSVQSLVDVLHASALAGHHPHPDLLTAAADILQNAELPLQVPLKIPTA